MVNASRFVLFACALVAAACASTATNVTPFGGVVEEPTVLTVENQNLNDLAIYLLTDGVSTRLGTALTMTRSKYTIPKELISVGAIRLHARLIGTDGGFTSQRILVHSGNHIDLRLARDLRLSDFMVW